MMGISVLSDGDFDNKDSWTEPGQELIVDNLWYYK